LWVWRYRVTKHREELPKEARLRYIQDVGTLVALLVINDRARDASMVYDAALGVVNDVDFRTIMDAAMTGHLPDRRPR
jgi:hypothetical protein